MKDSDRAADIISVIDAARECGKHKAAIFKVLKRLDIEPTKSRSTTNAGQIVAYITTDDLRRVREELQSRVASRSEAHHAQTSVAEDEFAEEGFFYLLALEPNHDPGWFKVGFAVRVSDRLRHLKCSAPFAKVIKTWPCKRRWEKTAIDCVTDGTERIHTEVFRTGDINTVQAGCESFFGLMPKSTGTLCI